MRRYLATTALLFTAHAAGVVITNHSFEEPVQGPNGHTTSDPVPGWTALSGGAWGVFYPTVATWGYHAPVGNQLLYTNGPTIEHITSEPLAEGVLYTLLIEVVNRPIYGGNNYFIEFWAGDVMLARDSNSLSPAPGESLTSSLSYTALAGDPAIGQLLTIRVGGASQSNFDDVRLIPTPGVLALLGLGLGIATWRRHR